MLLGSQARRCITNVLPPSLQYEGGVGRRSWSASLAAKIELSRAPCPATCKRRVSFPSGASLSCPRYYAVQHQRVP
jgi:hypothetical protein